MLKHEVHAGMSNINLDGMTKRELEKLRKDVDAAIVAFDERKREAALAAAKSAAEAHGFSLTQLIGGKKVKSSSPAKYRHPEDPTLTWSGRGRQPTWFKAAVDGGMSKDELSI